MSEIRDGQDLWQWFRLEIRLDAFRRSTIPQKHFLFNIIIVTLTLGFKVLFWPMEWTICAENKKTLISFLLRNFIEKTQKALCVLLSSKYKFISVNDFLLLNCSFFVFIHLSIVAPAFIKQNWRVDFPTVKISVNYEVICPGCIFL